MKSCLTYVLLAPGSLRQEASGKMGSLPSSPECAKHRRLGIPGKTPPVPAAKHMPGKGIQPPTEPGTPTSQGPLMRATAAALRPEQISLTCQIPQCHPCRPPGPSRRLGAEMGCPDLAGALALLPVLLWALPAAGTFLCPLCGPRGRQDWISPKPLAQPPLRKARRSALTAVTW